jgi:hypothetical protein
MPGVLSSTVKSTLCKSANAEAENHKKHGIKKERIRLSIKKEK